MMEGTSVPICHLSSANANFSLSFPHSHKSIVAALRELRSNLRWFSVAVGFTAIPAATYKVGSREGASAEEGNQDLHWLEQDATRMVCF